MTTILEQAPSPDTHVFRFNADADAADARGLERRMRLAGFTHPQTVVIDLGRVATLDTALCDALVRSYRRLTANGARVVLRGATPAVTSRLFAQA